MLSKKTIAVLFGGVSSEHDVSCVSAASVLDNIDEGKFDIYKVGITKTGRWKLFTGDNSLLPNDKWDTPEYTTHAFIPPDSEIGGLMIFEPQGVRTVKLDAVFPVLHGKNGEDGTVQGLLQLAQIPYVGCNCAVSVVCMDKALTNSACDMAGVAQANWVEMIKSDYLSDKESCVANAAEYLGYPIFVKPANAGSSVGITKAHDETELEKGIEPQDFAQLYPEYNALAGGCRFQPCLHDREPGCAVHAAVDRGELSAARWARYRELLGEVREKWKGRYI